MANRNWRSGGNYQSFNQLLNPMPYYPPPMNYSNDRKNYGGRVGGGGYRDDNYKRERKDFQSGRRDRISPNRRRSPYQRSHDSHGDFRRDNAATTAAIGTAKKSSHGRYDVKAPRLTFDIKELSTSSLKLRYPKMYIPSDFFHTDLRWQEVFPLYRTMKLGNHSEFQILHKDVEIDGYQQQQGELVEPCDVNYTYSAKVMLMTMPNGADLYKATCNLSTSSSSNTKCLNKNIQFLVGSKGKNEPMAIGGPWSPSLDGADPDGDSSVLVNTAIRNCRALTGIDLSSCKKWYKFLEIHYYRPADRQGIIQTGDGDKEESNQSLNETEARVEKVVIFIPDIWSCMPNEIEWSEIRATFEKKLSSLISIDTAPEDMIEEVNESKIVEDVKLEEEKVIEETTSEESQNLSQLKVVELKAELSSRGLDTKGVKSQLIERLQEALDKEKGKTVVEEISNEPEKPTEEAIEVTDKEAVTEHSTVVVEEPKKTEESKELSEKERKRLEKLYKLNDTPSILVFPNKTAKAGKFECNIMSLESLMEYRLDDQKEHIFEVSLFAEQMNEMLQRDAAFYIFKSLSELPDSSADSTEPASKKPKIETTETKVTRKSKMIADMHLLFSFCVFDYDNCGYLKDHDLEDIIHSIGLNFSRSQVRKLISKIPNKRGNLQYREITDKEIIEGSEDDVAVLKDGKCNIDKVVELSKGNKAFFEECDNQEMISREGNLDLLDKLCAVENKKMNYESQLVFVKDELTKIKSIHSDAGVVETNLRESIRKVQEKLETEKETHLKLSDIIKVYNSILKSATDNMGLSIKTINDQFEKEKLLIEEAKAKEEAEKKMEVEETKEPEVNEDKSWQVVDQV